MGVDAGKPESPRWSWVCPEMNSAEALFVWLGSEGPLGGASSSDDVVFCAHGIDMPAGIEVEIAGVVNQHARAADGDEVVGVELTPIVLLATSMSTECTEI